MHSSIRRYARYGAVGLSVAWMSLAPAGAQQNRLTEAQTQSAAAEVPRLADAFGLTAGMTVADVGAGFGAWTRQFSKVVGPNGRVFATEIGAPQLTALREAVVKEGLANVMVIEGAVDNTNLPTGCCDAILIRDAYHHLTAPAAMIKSIAAALKPGGRLAVVDFPPRPGSELPDGVPADRGGHGVPPEVVQREVGAHLTHVSTTSDWAPGSQPASLFLALFEKKP
jgi:ubiquinone/menaquinone biosynthesis C-methylase UbiE